MNLSIFNCFSCLFMFVNTDLQVNAMIHFQVLNEGFSENISYPCDSIAFTEYLINTGHSIVYHSTINLNVHDMIHTLESASITVISRELKLL